MFCGSCLHDNTLVASLLRQGHDALLVPTYTPIRTDEENVSSKRIFFGGINVYLQQKVPFFRRTPWFIDRFFNGRWLLKLAAQMATKTRAEELGDLAISMLKGEHGHQRKEIEKLVHWLETENKPEIINLSNVLLSGMVHVLKDRLKVPILATLQGDDVFLEALPEQYRAEAIKLIKEHCQEIDGFIATSAYYADFMSQYLDIPREKIDVIYPGLNLSGHGLARPERYGEPFTVGYFARICPEKGLHHLVEAFGLLHQDSATPMCRLRVSGWLGEDQRDYLDELHSRLKKWQLHDRFEHIHSPDHKSKVQFLHGIDVLSVPTTYHEPKGLYVLEALANGIPVVQPKHGSFPELIEATGGGLLVKPGDAEELARALRQLMDNPAHREELGRKGKQAVFDRFHADAMAKQTFEVYQKYL